MAVKTARDDQREVNNLPKLHEDQQQGRMLVIDEASDREKKIAGNVILGFGEEFRIKQIRGYLLDIQDFVFRHRGSKEPSVAAGEIEALKSKVQRALDLT
jgi:hypothetical protein